VEQSEVNDDGSTVIPERRRSPRLRATLPATLHRLGHGDDPKKVTTIDVSQGGARLVADQAICVGDVLQISVKMPHGLELTLQGLVVQLTDAEGAHHAHVAFDSLSAAAADLLTDLLNEQIDRQAAKRQQQQ
jgi:hypothetical protein